MLSGVPYFPTYSRSLENYMAIEDGEWEVRIDFTSTYTVTADELGLNNNTSSRTKKTLFDYIFKW